jgi:hypothetical protein
VTETPCPHCGEPVDPRQLVCTRCGGRIALRERRSLAREPMTAVATALVAVIAIGAGLFGFAISELASSGDDAGGGARASVTAGQTPAERTKTASDQPTAPAVVGGGTQEQQAPAGAGGGAQEQQAPAGAGGDAQEQQAPAGGGAQEQAPDRRNAVPGWPKGLRAHTVVLVTTSDRAAALNVAKGARSGGLEAGLMPSDPYDLGTGLWIVYSGQFTTAEGAQRQATQLAGRYPGAYPQLIQSSQ